MDDLKVFGCEFLHLTTQTCLEDPIWDKLQQSMEYCIIFKDCSEVLPSQELLEGYPIHKIPLAVHVPMNPEGVVPEGSQECHAHVMSALSQVLDLSAQKHGNRADSSELSSCRQQSWAFLTTHLEVVNCSTVSLPLVAESLATKPLMSAVHCSG